MRHGLSIPVFDEPDRLLALGRAAEAHGWDGVFLWHHVVGTPDFPVPVADAWVLLGALAATTERVRIGTMVTGLPRHQPQEVARQAVTVDRLSGGRMTLGVGLGEPPSEYAALGRSADRALLAEQLDESLEVIAALWTGEVVTHRGRHHTLEEVQFLPGPQQQPRIPVWTSAMTRNERTLGRAARWDGVVLGEMGEMGMGVLDPAAVAEVAARPDVPDDVVVAAPPGSDLAAYAGAGATWAVVAGQLDELEEVAAAPPPG